MGRAQVAIIGASAAGLAAAIAAARAGADVTLFERRTSIGDPPAPAIVGFDFLWPATIDRPPHAVRRRLEGAHVRGADGQGPRIDAPLTLFDRTKFDTHLAAEAERAGATIEVGASPDIDALVAGRRMVIFADGARSQVNRFLRSTRDPDALAWGAALEVDAPGEADHLTITLGPHAPGGRSQLNPLGNGRWSHWTFFRADAKHAEAIARAALSLDARLMGWKAPVARFMGVAPDPVYTLPGELTRKNILVAGGAAGQGGLEVGLAAGWMAGDAAARGRPRDYARAWTSRYQKGYERLRKVTDALGRLDEAELRAMLAPWNGARIAMPLTARPLLARPRAAAALARAGWLAWARA